MNSLQLEPRSRKIFWTSRNEIPTFGRAEIRIGKTVPDQTTDPSKQLFRMP
jgi:hypothetical protein